jgi:hypothetical protein
MSRHVSLSFSLSSLCIVVFPDWWGRCIQGNKTIHIQRWLPVCLHGLGIVQYPNPLVCFYHSFFFLFKREKEKENAIKISFSFFLLELVLSICSYSSIKNKKKKRIVKRNLSYVHICSPAPIISIYCKIKTWRNKMFKVWKHLNV